MAREVVAPRVEGLEIVPGARCLTERVPQPGSLGLRCLHGPGQLVHRIPHLLQCLRLGLEESMRPAIVRPVFGEGRVVPVGSGGQSGGKLGDRVEGGTHCLQVLACRLLRVRHLPHRCRQLRVARLLRFARLLDLGCKGGDCVQERLQDLQLAACRLLHCVVLRGDAGRALVDRCEERIERLPVSLCQALLGFAWAKKIRLVCHGSTPLSCHQPLPRHERNAHKSQEMQPPNARRGVFRSAPGAKPLHVGAVVDTANAACPCVNALPQIDPPSSSNR